MFPITFLFRTTYRFILIHQFMLYTTISYILLFVSNQRLSLIKYFPNTSGCTLLFQQTCVTTM